MLLKIQNVFKQFFDVNVLSSVDFELKAGEVHALLGLNGAGKTTLINIISGLYEPDYGNIMMNNLPVKISSPSQAHKLGIFTIHQVPMLVENLSVEENIFLGNEPRRLKKFIDYKKIRQESLKVLRLLGSSLDPTLPVGSLSLSEQYVVAIAKCFVINPKILILDEPTVGLSEKERETLFKLIRNLKRKKTGIIYITHQLHELSRICDRITILKDGRNIMTCRIDEISKEKIIETMCGRTIVQYFPEHNRNYGRELLKLEHVSLDNKLTDINFSMREGEVLGIAGLAGSGKADLAKIIFGQYAIQEGRILWKGKEVRFNHPSHAIEKSFGYVSSNRFKAGLFMDMDVTENLTIARLTKGNTWQLIKLKNERESVVDKIMELDIKILSLEQDVKYLSGGNQQKILLGRWLMSESELFILEEPTQGIDIASRSDIYLAIRDLAEQGKSIIILTEDIKELIGLCTRIIVMNNGKIVDEMRLEEITEERILREMTITKKYA